MDFLAPRFGIYAPQSGVPRIAQLEHQEGYRFEFLAASRANILLQNRNGRLYQMDISQPESPRLVNVLVLPPGIQAHNLDSAGHLYTLQTREGQNTLLIYDLTKTTPPVVDWKVLSKAWNAALKTYGGKDDSKDGMQSHQELVAAIQKFDEAGVVLALDAKVEGISDKTAAAILNDYAFLLSEPYLQESPYVEALLRRAITLDPDRAPAYLNLADQLRDSLSGIYDRKKKQATRAEAEEYYKKYLALGGKRTARITAFLHNTPGKNPPKDTCSAIAKYASAGLLDELVSDKGVNLPKDGGKFDFVVATVEGPAHVPDFNVFNASDDTYINIKTSLLPETDDLWDGGNVGVVAFQDQVHILHYHDLQRPVASMSLSGDESCHFKIKTIEKIGSKALEPALCAQLSAGKGPAPLKFNGPAKINPIDIANKNENTLSVSVLKGTKKLDVANDGNPINVGAFDLVRYMDDDDGCKERFFDQLDASGRQFESGPKQSLLMALQHAYPSNPFPLHCSKAAKFFRYQGKVYFENKPSTWPPINKYQEYHRVARINDGKIEDVCDFNFITTVSVKKEKAINKN